MLLVKMDHRRIRCLKKPDTHPQLLMHLAQAADSETELDRARESCCDYEAKHLANDKPFSGQGSLIDLNETSLLH